MSDPSRHHRDEDESLRNLGFVYVVVIAIIIGLIAVFFSRPARAETICGPWKVMKSAFAATYGEKPIGGGVATPSSMVTVLASPGGATFTIIVDKNGMACAIAAGKDWQPGKLLDIGEQG